AVKQHEAGNITDLDLENEQAMYEQAKLELSRAERDLLLSREALIRSMGLRDATVEWRVPENFPSLPGSELDQQQLEQLAAAQRLRARHLLNALLSESSSALRAAHTSVAEARARVEYFRDVLLPRRARIVELTKLEHNAMLVGVFQLLQAKQNEAEAQRDSIE